MHVGQTYNTIYNYNNNTNLDWDGVYCLLKQ